MTDPLTVRCASCLAPPGAPCRGTFTREARAYHSVREGDARAHKTPPPLADFTDLDSPIPDNDLALRALRARAGAFGMAVRIRPADHAPDRAVYPLRLELTDARDARRVIGAYTARDGEHAGTGLRTLLAVLP